MKIVFCFEALPLIISMIPEHLQDIVCVSWSASGLPYGVKFGPTGFPYLATAVGEYCCPHDLMPNLKRHHGRNIVPPLRLDLIDPTSDSDSDDNTSDSDDVEDYGGAMHWPTGIKRKTLASVRSRFEYNVPKCMRLNEDGQMEFIATTPHLSDKSTTVGDITTRSPSISTNDSQQPGPKQVV